MTPDEFEARLEELLDLQAQAYKDEEWMQEIAAQIDLLHFEYTFQHNNEPVTVDMFEQDYFEPPMTEEEDPLEFRW